MLVLAVGMGFLFVPLTSTAVAGVANTDAGLASALLNVGQQVGGALGLSVMTTVFGTASRNYASDHGNSLFQQLNQSVGGDKQLAGAIAGRIKQAGDNGLQAEDIKKFISGLPADQQAAASKFFDGTFKDFTHHLLAHASGLGFLTAAMFGVVAIIASVVLINVKKTDIPADAITAGVRAGCARSDLDALGEVYPAPHQDRGVRPSRTASTSALDDVHREAAACRLLVLDLHVGAGLAHRLDHLVEADDVLAAAA